MPKKYGNWRDVYNRLRMWAVDGTWERVCTALIAQPTPTRTSTGPSRWTPRSCAPTSTRPEPAEWGPGRRTGRPRHRPPAAG
ncbi:transposase [Streptomyces violaceus]|uniref:transposase n=1 Tax=Streptomyces violaceus TaxID=1936 RepID=UPI00399D75BC